MKEGELYVNGIPVAAQRTRGSRIKELNGVFLPAKIFEKPYELLRLQTLAQEKPTSYKNS